MQIVNAREFRSNQGRFLTAARAGKSVVLVSRYGNFRIVPVADTDVIIDKDIRLACTEVKDHLEGKIKLPAAKDIVF